MRREGLVVFPEDLGIRRTDATRELLAAKNIADLVTWSDGLYQPLQSLELVMMAQVQYQTFSDSQLLADMAVEALIDEVNLTPKPALVDRRGSGAHDDLTLELMERSAKSLGPMFEAMAQAAKHHGKVCLALREDIGEIGRQGEKVMMLATDGVNTHRGAIWALGLMVTAAALARTNQQYLSAVELCQLAGQIAQLEDRFIPKQALSHGQQVQKKLGILGAKNRHNKAFQPS